MTDHGELASVSDAEGPARPRGVSKAALLRRIRAIAATGEVGTVIAGRDAAFLTRQYELQVGDGHAVAWATRADTLSGHRGLSAKLADGRDVMPSMGKLAGLQGTDRSSMVQAMRRAITDQTSALLPAVCDRCWNDAVQVHHDGRSFAELVGDFIDENGIPQLATADEGRLGLRRALIGDVRRELADPAPWQQFHWTHARLVPLCTDCHGRAHSRT